jgi:Flp pilus assembly pilin Flp
VIHEPSASACPDPSLLNHSGGATAVEYVVILVLVSVGASATIAAMGTLVARFFAAQQAWLLLPFP